MQLEVVEDFHFAGTDYTAGQLIDTTALPPRMVRQLLGRFPVAVAGGGGGGTGGQETDPIAGPALTTHKGSTDHDAHNDARLAPKVHTHTGAYEPAGAVATHAGAADPHGDRGYADTRIAALVNAAPAALDTLAEIDAQLASDESGAAAMQASINTKAPQASLDAHINNAAGAHAASAVSVNPAGLIVVTGNNVQDALAELDAWANGRPTNESGTLAAMPANGARPNNSTYFATDQNGGTTYRMVAGAWVQQSAGVSQASGAYAAGPVQLAAGVNYNVGAETDMPGMSIAVPASPNRGIMLRAVLQLLVTTGTAAAGATVITQTYLTDNANAHKAGAFESFTSGSATSQTQSKVTTVEFYLPAPVAAATYKLRFKLSAALPAGWGTVQVDPTAFGNIANGVNNLVAEYK